MPELEFHQIELSGEGLLQRLDYNEMLVLAIRGQIPAANPANPPSELSGAPAIRYRSNRITLDLSPEEIGRLVLCNLTAEEFFRLRDRHGIFFEIHDDFYDPKTGAAIAHGVSST